jgi:hypothetical protein
MFVVCGHTHDGSGQSEQVYGPYSQARAETLAGELNGGTWNLMEWEAVPLVATPWEAASGSQEPPTVAPGLDSWRSAPERREGRGRAVLHINHRVLKSLLHLPAGMGIAAVVSDFMRSSVVLLVESADLPEMPPGTTFPELDGEFRAEIKDGPGWSSPTGWWRWAWSPAEAASVTDVVS